MAAQPGRHPDPLVHLHHTCLSEQRFTSPVKYGILKSVGAVSSGENVRPPHRGGRKVAGSSPALATRVDECNNRSGEQPAAASNMAFYVYVLQLEGQKRYYIAHTKNLENRLRQHLEGETHSLKGRTIVRVVYVEEFATRAEAVKRERSLKGFWGRAKLPALIASWAVSSGGERYVDTVEVAGSIPAPPTTGCERGVSSGGERPPRLGRKVAGSIPAPPTSLTVSSQRVRSSVSPRAQFHSWRRTRSQGISNGKD